ncbi:hypothetical protein [Nonomuraea sp. NPDC003201]
MALPHLIDDDGHLFQPGDVISLARLSGSPGYDAQHIARRRHHRRAAELPPRFIRGHL